MTPFKPLERLTLIAPLGLRFSDEVTRSFIGDGLNVSLYEPNKPTIKVQALANRSGVYVVHKVPGMVDFDHGPGDDHFWSNPLLKRSFVVAVTDTERRFQPFQFAADLPARGIFNWTSPLGNSLPAGVPSIPLYSSPVRNVPPGMAVLRAELLDGAHQLPAAWAVLEAYINNRLVARGVADDKGRIALIFPQPAPRSFTISSPPGSPISSPPAASGLPLTKQVWPITLRARYDQIAPLPLLAGVFAAEPQLPDLGVTFSQPEATLWADTECTEPLGEVALSYGRELILKSRPTSSSPPARQSALLIKPAASPP